MIDHPPTPAWFQFLEIINFATKCLDFGTYVTALLAQDHHQHLHRSSLNNKPNPVTFLTELQVAINEQEVDVQRRENKGAP